MLLTVVLAVSTLSATIVVLVSFIAWWTRPSRWDQAPARFYEWRAKHVEQRAAAVRGPGLSADGWKAALVMEGWDTWLRSRFLAGWLVILTAASLPAVSVWILTAPSSTALAGTSRLTVGIISAASFAPLALAVAYQLWTTSRAPQSWPVDAEIWWNARLLVFNEDDPTAGPRRRAVRRAHRLEALSRLAAQDVGRFASPGSQGLAIVRAQRVAAAVRAFQDEVALAPYEHQDLQPVRKALDAWLLGQWHSLPERDVTAGGNASVPASFSRRAWLIAVSMLLYLAVVGAVSIVLGKEAAVATIPALLVLILPLRREVKRLMRSDRWRSPRPR